MVEPRPSVQILERLLTDAAEMKRSEVREATIKRLVEACDSIENGSALELVREQLGKGFGGLRNRIINPSTVERFVLAKRSSGAAAWTGPKRVTIQNDPNLKAYVEARENERIKPHIPKIVTSRVQRLQEAIDTIPDSMKRDFVRGEFASLHDVRNENDVLTHMLKLVDPVKFEAFRNPKLQSGNQESESTAVASDEHWNASEIRECLETLAKRLSDPNELALIGFELYRGRIRHKNTGRQFITKDELSALQRLLDDSV